MLCGCPHDHEEQVGAVLWHGELCHALAEALRFSDPVSSAATADIEENLTGLLEELGSAVLDKDYASVKTLCAKASTLLADRNRMCKLNK